MLTQRHGQWPRPHEQRERDATFWPWLLSSALLAACMVVAFIVGRVTG